MIGRRQETLRLFAIAAFIFTALAQHWLAPQRLGSFEQAVARELVVTSTEDAGPGTLREAIFEAARSTQRVRIVLRVPRLRIATPLPPLTGPHGIVFESEELALLDARGLEGVAALQIDSAGSIVRRIRIEGAGDTAVLVRAAHVQLSAVEITDAHVGISVAPELVGTRIVDSRFERNHRAVQLERSGAGTAIESSVFVENREVGIWLNGPAQGRPHGAAERRIARNRFEGNGHALVAVNEAAEIEGNKIAAQRRGGILLMNSESVVRGNRLHRNAGSAIEIDGGRAVYVTGNEIDGHAGIAILARGARVAIEKNRLHTNGSGIVSLLDAPANPSSIRGNILLDHAQDALVIIGGSPHVQGNRIMRASEYALHLLDYHDGQSLHRAAPLLERNVLRDNRVNQPHRGVYRHGARS